MPSRGVDKLDAVLPDAKLKQQDQAYLERHKIDQLLGETLQNMIMLKPADPIQYIIDSVEYSADYALQDPVTGLPEHRKSKLLDVFRCIDKEGRGKVSLQNLQTYTSKYGGSTLGQQELQSMFTDFQPGKDNLITQHEFLIFFSKVSRTIPNAAFDELIKELMA